MGVSPNGGSPNGGSPIGVSPIDPSVQMGVVQLGVVQLGVVQLGSVQMGVDLTIEALTGKKIRTSEGPLETLFPFSRVSTAYPALQCSAVHQIDHFHFF